MEARQFSCPGVVMSSTFDQLDVYRAAIEFVGMTRPLVLRLRTKDPVLFDQLHRSLVSIPCNIAEGAGEFSPGDKARFYRYALRSTTEAVSLIDTAHAIGLCSDDEHARWRQAGMRIVAMMTKLVLSVRARTGPNDRDTKKNV